MSIPVTIKYQADDTLNGEGYVEINGTKYRASKGKSDTNLTLSKGDEIIFCIWTRYSSIVVDGETIIYLDLSSNGSYHTITVDDTMSAIEIQFKEVGTGISMVTTFTATITKAASPQAHKTLVDNVGWAITAGRCLVDSVGYSIKKGRTLVDGVGYDVAFGNGFTSENIEVGSSVFANVNGVRTEFLVVHQGLPSSMYDASCDGTWLLMKDIYEKRTWHSSYSNSYKDSTINTYLNGTFLNLFDADIKAQIKTAKIPHVNGSGNSAVASGSSGLSVQIFLLSVYEVGFTKATSSNFPIDGACLSHFNGTSSVDSKRIAYLNGSATYWWLRSHPLSGTDLAYMVHLNGGYYGDSCPKSYGIRPAFILDSSAAIDPDTFDILG